MIEASSDGDRRIPTMIERIGRALASPIGVLVTVPLLVVIVGVGILLVGRDTIRTATEAMARHQLEVQATSIDADVDFALDQAGPMLARLRTLADPARPRQDVLLRLHDLVVARPGVAYASLSFPDGTFRGAYLEHGRVEVQESRVEPSGTTRQRFTIDGATLVPLRDEHDTYDPRTRGFYQLAAKGARAWTAPYTFFASNATGVTCSEPMYEGRELVAVLTVDFDVGALSSYLARPVLDEARTIVFSGDGTILASPASPRLPTSDRLLRPADLHDPAIDALFAGAGPGRGFRELATADGDYLASVAPVGGTRAGVATPLDWYIATVVPARTLLGPTHALARTSLVASAGALAIAVGLALVLAWNLVRMRRQVAASRARAKSAEARAVELGSYRLVAKLGTGGMGEVWRAEHRLLARSAAIKLIRPEVMRDPAGVAEVLERFRREAQTLASMRSRHTIEIFDYGVTAEGVFYYVMELLDGLDLEALVVRYGPQPAPRVIGLLVQACGSLAEAHDAGMLHRDIKPPNLFASRAADEVDIVKLLDFGIVQTAGDPVADAVHANTSAELPRLTRHGSMLGTPGFMPPEQILGMTLDGRADLYALGCVAWWLLTGREVFARDGDPPILRRHIHEPVPRLRDAMTGWCPAELEAAITACLAKDAADRPADARALAALLRAIPIPAEQAWTEARAQSWWRAWQPPVPAPSVSTSAIQLIMPGRIELEP